jgi:hypothetical protein
MTRLRLADWVYVWSGFDPDDYRTDSLPRALRPVHRAYLYASVRVTGHTAHAFNALLAWLAILGPLWLPLGLWWLVPIAFYTMREGPSLWRGEGDVLDHAGDVMWVYAVGVALWLPWWCLILWLIPTVAVQIAYYLRPAPKWMPRDALLWGR